MGHFDHNPPKNAVEHLVYVHQDYLGAGFGRLLVERLVAKVRSQGKHTVIGAINAGNEASIGLSERWVFRIETLQQVGFKFGRWLDLALVQLTLQMRVNPIDG